MKEFKFKRTVTVLLRLIAVVNILFCLYGLYINFVQGNNAEFIWIVPSVILIVLQILLFCYMSGLTDFKFKEVLLSIFVLEVTFMLPVNSKVEDNVSKLSNIYQIQLFSWDGNSLKMSIGK